MVETTEIIKSFNLSETEGKSEPRDRTEVLTKVNKYLSEKKNKNLIWNFFIEPLFLI